ncbi:ABC transporter permease [Clostridium kluyveri]|uniref:ABC transporter permease n=1 Tax=Clostridium kluyveri TaxID=1534 RepID=UPI0022470D84|nr:ABC transporter permease [Clostridium kluyveri]UZQ50713.1 ABC transporter permease [Clostridium kluyveri]
MGIKYFLRDKKRNYGRLFTPAVVISFLVLIVIITSAILAPLIAPYDPNKIDLSLSLQNPSHLHILGTDKTGRDIFSRMIFGARTTLLSAVYVVLISVVIGIPCGLICGYYGGKIDVLIMRIWDVILSFPSLLLAFIFVASFGRGMGNAIVAIGIIYIPMISRLTRSLTLVEKNKTYVEAAQSIGCSSRRILFVHILPNCIPTLLSELTLDLGYAMLDLAALSFLGLGVQPPTSDWGAMLEEAREFIQNKPIPAVAPGIAIIITVVSINVLSDGVQMYLNQSQRKLPSFKEFRKLAGDKNG